MRRKNKSVSKRFSENVLEQRFRGGERQKEQDGGQRSDGRGRVRIRIGQGPEVQSRGAVPEERVIGVY